MEISDYQTSHPISKNGFAEKSLSVKLPFSTGIMFDRLNSVFRQKSDFEKSVLLVKFSLFGHFGTRMCVGLITRKLKGLFSCNFIFSIDFLLEGINSVATEKNDEKCPDEMAAKHL